MDSAIFEKIEHQKIDALIHKKKHFNAADRKRKYHHKLGISAVVISFLLLLLNGLVKFADIFGQADWILWVNLILIIGVTVLLGIQALFKFMPSVTEHEETAADFLALAKEYGRLIAAHKNDIFELKATYEKFDKLSEKHEMLIQKSKALSTNDVDLQKAEKGIEDDEEGYEKERQKNESAILEKADEGRIDALYEEKKHDNAAKRKKKINTFYLWVPAFVINGVVGLILLLEGLQIINVLQADWLKWIGAFLILIAAILILIQTYFNFMPFINGHKRMAAKFLALGNKYERLIVAYKDQAFDSKELYDRLENLSEKHSEMLRDGHAFPTSYDDYLKARERIQA
jgi:cation transport ATPase